MIYTKDVMSIASVLGEWVDLAPLFFIWTLIYVTYIIFIEQQKLIKEKYEITLELKESELSNLRNQLSPHFLFNSINNLRSLILVDPEKARSGLLEMSDLLRYVLNYQKHRTVALEEELEVVNSYLELNKIHLGDNVNFEVDFDSSLLNFQIPPMSIQLLVENAIKHGEIKDNASVSIKALKRDADILFEITNPGNLGKDSEYGIGLKNLRARLKSVFGERVTFTIQEKDQLVIAEILIQND